MTMDMGAELTRKIEVSGFKNKIADGTMKIIDSSKQIGSEVMQATSETFNSIAVKILLVLIIFLQSNTAINRFTS